MRHRPIPTLTETSAEAIPTAALAAASATVVRQQHPLVVPVALVAIAEVAEVLAAAVALVAVAAAEAAQAVAVLAADVAKRPAANWLQMIHPSINF